jgi:hypothetical protein
MQASHPLVALTTMHTISNVTLLGDAVHAQTAQPLRRGSKLAHMMPMMCPPLAIHGRCLHPSAFVTAALVREMDGTSDMMLILRRLDRLGRAVARVRRDLELLLAVMGAYVFRSLAHEPNVPDELRAEMRARGADRYKQFVDHVGKRFAGGHRSVDNLPHEVIANDAALDAMLAKSTGTGGGL